MKSDSVFLLESAAWPAFLVDGGGTVRKANQAAIGLFGTMLEGETTMLSALWAEPAESAEQFLARWERSTPAVVPLKLHGKGGMVTTFNAWIASFNWEGQKRFVFQLFPELASGPAEHRAPVIEANLAQKQKLDCALQLARTVALDFNNVLTSILGHASLVLSQMEPSHPWRESLVEVQKAAERAAEVAGQLAAFSRTEKEAPGPVVGNLNALLRRAVELFQRANRPGISWALNLETRLHSAGFDEAKIQQAVARILENAIEAMGDRGELAITSRNLDVAVATYDGTVRLEPGTYVCAEIGDTGPGIKPEVLPHIFDPFFTTKEGHRGLGLAWVYGIITNYGGGVTVASEPGKGASVRLYLPANKQIVTGEGVGVLDDLRGKETILVVDDEDLVLNMGRTILSSFGYRVLTATSGARALEILSQAEPGVDLVITDLVMPQMSGRELKEKIHDLSPEIRMIFTSGYVRTAGQESGAAFLPKPFTSQDLLRHVKEVLTASEVT